MKHTWRGFINARRFFGSHKYKEPLKTLVRRKTKISISFFDIETNEYIISK
jgi:hypothetical protein